jgi:hypothetical protein
VKPEVRLKAATELLNRSGLHAHTEHTVKVERQLDERQQIERIRDLALRLGMDPRAVLGTVGVTDAEFEVISGPTLSAAGLEDLLE